MKTKMFLVIIMIVAYFTCVCAAKDHTYKATIVAEFHGSAVSSEKMTDAVSVLRKRLTAYGVQEKDIKLEIKSDTISLMLTETENISLPAIRSLIINNPDRLEFWETYENSELAGTLAKANSVKPLFRILKPRTDNEGKPMRTCLIGLSEGKDTALVNRYMKQPEIKALFPSNLRFYWSEKPYRYFPKENLYELHAIKVTSSNGQAPLDGTVIVDATPVKSNSGNFFIRLTMNSEGTARWASVTRQNIGRCIAVVLNDHVRAYPVVQAEISGGKTEISGDFTEEEAGVMANIFKSGQLPVKLRIIDEQQ